MKQIKKIEFIKAVYDETLSHNIYSIANIEFKNFPPIQGALLYWNHSDDEVHPNTDDVKFYYEQSSSGYYTSVKFPRNNGLTLQERIELTRLLLDERSEIGSYTISTNPVIRSKRFQIDKEFDLLGFPDQFDVSTVPYTVGATLNEMDFEEVCAKNPSVTSEFIQAYCFWRANALQLHPEQFENFLDFIDFAAVCYSCKDINEKFLIRYLDRINYEALQLNTTVMSRLSSYFIEQSGGMLDKELAQKMYMEHYLIQEPAVEPLLDNDPVLATLLAFNDETIEDDYEDDHPYLYFTLDRGTYRWAGAEHLIKNIPSFASQQYDEFGYKKLTNAQMDKVVASLNNTQLNHVAAILEQHWLHRYRDQLNWKIICKENKQLDSDFLQAHIKFIDFESLGENSHCSVDNTFLSKYFYRFDHSKPLPLFICHLTLGFFLEHQGELLIDEKVFKKSYKTIPFDDYVTIATMLGYENDDDYQ